MTNVRESDTSLWLHNKLGSSSDLWSCGSICSQLNLDVLKNIRECFTDLQSLVKLKLLISFLHIPRRNVEEWKTELKDILELGVADSDQWVSTSAELLKFYPETGMINFSIEENGAVFTDLISELKKILKRHGDIGILPLECLYLNQKCLSSQIGQITQPIKHFTLKRKPKSAALRAELLQKSLDVASSTRKNSLNTSAAFRSRNLSKDINDSTPLKGIPSRGFISLSGSFKTSGLMSKTASVGRNPTRPSLPGVRRDIGIKLLDINEQPIGRDAKRKKKVHDETENISKQKELEKINEKHNPTPDYAVGLTLNVQQNPSTYPLGQSNSSIQNTDYQQRSEKMKVLEEQIELSLVDNTADIQNSVIVDDQVQGDSFTHETNNNNNEVTYSI